MKTAQEIYEYHGGFTVKELADPGLCELRDRAFELERENAQLIQDYRAVQARLLKSARELAERISREKLREQMQAPSKK